MVALAKRPLPFKPEWLGNADHSGSGSLAQCAAGRFLAVTRAIGNPNGAMGAGPFGRHGLGNSGSGNCPAGDSTFSLSRGRADDWGSAGNVRQRTDYDR